MDSDEMERLRRIQEDVMKFKDERIKAESKEGSSLLTQVGGDHYNMEIQPIQYIHANNIGYCEGNVIKYVSRWRDKNGLADLEKAKHYIELLIELEGLK